MDNHEWVVLDQISGPAKANILKGFLEAQGIQVFLSQEGIGESIYPVSVGPLSEVQLLVPSSQLEDAQKILADYDAGIYQDISSQYLTKDEEDQKPGSNQG